jgi:tetratricopeptide (TPR) repeat protein
MMSLDAPNPFAPWRARPIFISSTFRDMHAERDWLYQRVFPDIEEKLRQRRHHLEPVDLRLGIETAGDGSEEDLEVRVLRICLDEIRRSRPFMIVLLGDRYGWVPRPDRIERAAEQQGFATQAAGKSVTALEIEFGLLREDPEQQPRCLFFFRRPLPFDRMTEAQRAEYSDAASPDPAVRTGQARLEQLKARIRAHAEFGSRVFEYDADWDPASGRVTGLEAFGELVTEQLWQALDEETAGFAQRGAGTWEEQERAALAEFVEQHAHGFVGREGIVARLEETARGRAAGAERGACVLGVPGAGKSALFSTLHRRLAADTGLVVLACTAGGTPRGASVDATLRRWTGELAAAVGVPDPLSLLSSMETVEEAFHELLARAGGQRRVAILLDAPDQMEPTPRGRHVTWLRRDAWPDHARVIALGQPGVPMGAIRNWPGVASIELPPLSPAEALQVGRAMWQGYHREIDPAVLDVLGEKADGSGAASIGNPLWLTLALEQLNLLDADDFTRADQMPGESPTQRIRQLVLDTARRLPGDLEGLHHWQFDRVGRLLGANLVRPFLAVIALGRRGWRESDLQPLLRWIHVAMMDVPDADIPQAVAWAHFLRRERKPEPEANPAIAAFRAQFEVPPLTLATIRRSLGLALTLRDELRWDFAHAQTRAAVLSYLALSERAALCVHERVAEHLVGLPDEDPLRCGELVYHLLRAGEEPWIQVFYGSRSGTHPLARAAATRTLVDEVRDRGIEWLRRATEADVPLPRPILGMGVQVDEEDLRLFRLEAARGLCDNGVERLLPALKSSVPRALQAQVAGILLARIERVCAEVPEDAPSLRIRARLQTMASDLSAAGGDWAEAGDLAGRALAGFERLAAAAPGSWERRLDLGNGHLTQGDLQVQRGDLDGALASYERARECGGGPGSPISGVYAIACDKIGDTLRLRGRLDEARASYERALPVFRDLAEGDDDHARDLMLCLSKLATIAMQQERPDVARGHLEEQAGIARARALANPDDPERERDLSRAYGQMGSLARVTGDHAGARAHFERTREAMERLVARDPTNVAWRQDLAGSCFNCCQAAADGGDPEGARARLEACVAILLPLATEERLDAQGRGLLLAAATTSLSLPLDVTIRLMELALRRLLDEPDTESQRVLCAQAGLLSSRLLDEHRDDDARRLLEALVPIGERVFGVDSQESLAFVSNLGILHKRRGDLATAERLYRRVARGFAALPDVDARATGAAHRNLMWVLQRTRGVDGSVAPECGAVRGRAAITDHPKPVLAVALDATGQWLASGHADGMLCLRDLGSTAPSRRIQAHEQAVTGLAMNPEGTRVATCSWDRSVKLWDVRTGQMLAQRIHAESDLSAVAMARGGELLFFGGEDGQVCIWSPGSDVSGQVGAHGNGVMAVAVTADGLRVVSGGMDAEVHVMALEEPGRRAPIEGHNRSVNCIAIRSDGRRVVTGGHDHLVLECDLESREIVHAFHGHGDAVGCVALSADGRVAASGSRDRTVRFWDLERGAALSHLAFESEVWALAATPDLETLAVGELSGALSILTLDPAALVRDGAPPASDRGETT